MKKIKVSTYFKLILFILFPYLQNTLAQSISFTESNESLTGSLNSTITKKTVSSKTGSPSTAGSTVANFDVSPSGAATYTIPFSIPPGIKNIVPNVGLSYNSQSGNGVAGWGWNIFGLSSISRIPSTVYYDGEINPIKFDSKDRYALDGQRLILKSGSYGAANSEYQTSNYSNLKIVAKTSNNLYGPAYFIIYSPDGTKSYYGSTTTGVRHGARSVMQWALYKQEDPQGNFIKYEYTNNGYLLLINKIFYGSRGTTSAPNEIRFFYKDRERQESSYYEKGIEIKNAKVLSKVEIRGEGKLFRKYEIEHGKTYLGYEKVLSIKESNSSAKSFKPIEFQYEEVDEGKLISKTISTSSKIFDPEKDGLFSGDFDGDGKSDIGSFKVNGKVLTVTSSLGENTRIYKKSTSENIKQVFSSTILSFLNKIVPKQALTTISDYSDDVVRFKTYTVSDSGIPYYQYTKSITLPKYKSEGCTFKNYEKPFRYVSGDFDGDGLTDVMALGKEYTYRTKHKKFIGCKSKEHKGSSKQVYFINLKRTASNSTSPIGNLQYPIGKDDIVQVGDFNGDGKADIYHFYKYTVSSSVYLRGVMIYSLNNSGRLEVVGTSNSNYINIDSPILLADFNGDGKTDFLVANNIRRSTSTTRRTSGTVNTSSARKWSLFTASGDNLEESDFSGDLPVHSGSAGITYITQDINGDGKPDILKYRDVKPSSSNYLYYYLDVYYNSQDDDGLTFKKSEIDFNGRHLNSDKKVPMLLEVYQQNYNPEFVTLTDDRIDIFKFPRSHQKEMTLKTIKNNEISFDLNYESLGFSTSTNYNYTVSNSKETYPYVNINKAKNFKLVTSVQKTDYNISLSQEFKYGGAVSNLQGLGFLGFKELVRSNWYGGEVGRLWNISLHDLHKRGAVERDWVSNSSVSSISASNTNYINKKVYSYNSSLSSSKIFTNLISKIDIYDKLEGKQSSVENSYDSYKNITQTKTRILNTSIESIRTSTFSNNISEANYYIGRPVKIVEVNKLDGNTFTTEQEFSYRSKLVASIKKKSNSSSILEEAFTYDDYGNILTKTFKAAGKANRVKKYTYLKGRYLKTETDFEGITTTYNYDTAYGNLVSYTDQNGYITSYIYDGWNRLKSETDPYKNTNTVSFETTSINGKWVMSKKNNFADGAEVTKYYNAFGWLVKTKAKTINNKYIYKTFEYDEIGRIRRESEPYFSTVGSWNVTSYDSYGRVITQELFNGKIINTSYSLLTTTVDDGTKTKKITKDKAGNVKKIEDSGGTIYYTYHGNGSLKQVSFGNNVIVTEIDDWGRKKKLIDPSAGTYSYTYNNFGEVLTETTPKGTTTYDYDDFGKIKTKTIIGDNTNLSLNYNYNTTGFKLLKSIIGADNINNSNYTYNYEYYPTSSIKSIKEQTATATFEKKYTYDSFNRVSTEKFINNHTATGVSNIVHIQNEYDTGVLNKITDYVSKEILFDIKEENARRQVTNINLGNGITMSKKYDSFGFLEEIRDTKTGVDALKLDYSFDTSRGILNSRKNYAFGSWEESFKHDHLDRLTKISGSVSKEQKYYNDGRIQDNSDLGIYHYNSSKTYQLNKIDLNPKGKNYFKNNILQEVTYNAFKKAISINQKGHGKIDFEYGPLKNRTHSYYGGIETNKLERKFHKQYSSITPVEITHNKKTNSVKIITYVGGDAYGARIAHIKKTGLDVVEEYHYLHRDYLGSILAITDSNGDVKERRHFGAWGTTDKFIDSNGNTEFTSTALLDRGYTGHEHLFDVELIHMNGRVYDATFGRFLSPDSYVQDPYNTQNFNRYSYVLNNPLSFNDPSGEFWHIVIGAVVGGVINLAVKAYQGKIDSWGDGFAAFGVGALAGAVGVATGGLAFGAAGGAAGGAGGFLAGAAGGAVGTAFSSPIQNIGNHLFFNDPIMSGKEFLQGVAIGAVTGGAINGGIAGFKGNNFWTGNARVPGKSIFSFNNTTTPKVNNATTPIDVPSPEELFYNSNYKNPKDIKLPKQLSHYSVDDPNEWTSIGLIKDKPIYLTPDKSLSRVQALNDLALPGKAPNFRIDVNTTNGSFDVNKIMLIRRVNGNVFGHGGGGWEIIYKGPLNISKSNITITPLK